MNNKIKKEDIGLDRLQITDWIPATQYFFGSKRYSQKDGLLLYTEANQELQNYAVKIVFNKKHEIDKIYKGKSFSEDLRHKILNEINKIINNIETRVFQFPYLSRLPVVGYFKLNSDIQILPPKKSWPKDPYQMMQEKSCPFLVELKLFHLENNNYTTDLYSKTHKEIGYFLNLCLSSNIFYPNSKIKMEWGRCDNSSEAKYIQLGFISSLFRDNSKNFSSTENLNPMLMVSANDYYGKTRSLGDTQELPDNFVLLWSKYKDLKGEKKDNFERAIYWFYKSKCVEFESESLAFTSLIYAIESLISNTDNKTCSKCSGLTYSISRKFKDFFKSHAADAPTKTIDKLYSVRSQIAHGNKIFQHDFEIFSNIILPSNMEDSNDYRSCSHIVRIAILNWLLSV